MLVKRYKPLPLWERARGVVESNPHVMRATVSEVPLEG
jgi:hypothetical protein